MEDGHNSYPIVCYKGLKASKGIVNPPLVTTKVLAGNALYAGLGPPSKEYALKKKYPFKLLY